MKERTLTEEESRVIKNPSNEEIDVLVEGDQSSGITVVFVHGFGTNKDEGHNIFVDISGALEADFRIVRFDFTGYGESEGKEEDVSYEKQAKDLEAVLNWVKKKFGGEVHIIAHSMGNFVVALLSPDNIKKTAFSAIPNANTNHIAGLLQERIKSKPGGVVNEKGISLYPRSSGETQKVGPDFWRTLRAFDPARAVASYAKKTQLLIIHPLQDKIVGDKYLDAYQTISGAQYIEMSGDHNYSKREDRERVIKKIKEFFQTIV